MSQTKSTEQSLQQQQGQMQQESQVSKQQQGLLDALKIDEFAHYRRPQKGTYQEYTQSSVMNMWTDENGNIQFERGNERSQAYCKDGNIITDREQKFDTSEGNKIEAWERRFNDKGVKEIVDVKAGGAPKRKFMNISEDKREEFIKEWENRNEELGKPIKPQQHHLGYNEQGQLQNK